MTLVLAVVAAWRAGRRQTLRFGLVVAVALVAEIVGISRIAGPLYHWDLTYVPVTAMLAALAGAYCAWSALPTRTWLAWARPAAGVLLIGALVVPASMLTVTSSDPTRLQDYDGSRGVSLVERDTLRSLRGAKGAVFVRVLESSPSGYGNLAAMVLKLDQHGFHAVVSDAWRSIFPRSSIHTSNAVGAVVTVLSPSGARRYQPAPGERRVAGDPADKLNALVRGERLPPGTPVVFLAPGLPAGDLRPAVMGPGRRRNG
jgi:hypothetical protein